MFHVEDLLWVALIVVAAILSGFVGYALGHGDGSRAAPATEPEPRDTLVQAPAVVAPAPETAVVEDRDTLPSLRIHRLKTWPQFFSAVASGRKTFEWRRDDRDFEVGHMLVLEEWKPREQAYTGRQLSAEISYVMRDAGFAVLALAHVHEIQLNPELPSLPFEELPTLEAN